jgi:hypothetical protein
MQAQPRATLAEAILSESASRNGLIDFPGQADRISSLPSILAKA